LQTGPKPTTLGLLEPVGSERLKVCELFAELIHLQYLFTSSPLFEGLVQDYTVVAVADPLLSSSQTSTIAPQPPVSPTLAESKVRPETEPTEGLESNPTPLAPLPRFRVIDGLMRITEQLVERHIFKICFVSPSYLLRIVIKTTNSFLITIGLTKGPLFQFPMEQFPPLCRVRYDGQGL
jgi:hypothetical protein